MEGAMHSSAGWGGRGAYWVQMGPWRCLFTGSASLIIYATQNDTREDVALYPKQWSDAAGINNQDIILHTIVVLTWACRKISGLARLKRNYEATLNVSCIIT
jgi:hypothetical protein